MEKSLWENLKGHFRSAKDDKDIKELEERLNNADSRNFQLGLKVVEFNGEYYLKTGEKYTKLELNSDIGIYLNGVSIKDIDPCDLAKLFEEPTLRKIAIGPNATNRYCHGCEDNIDKGSSAYQCPKCASVYHPKCAEQNSACKICDYPYVLSKKID